MGQKKGSAVRCTVNGTECQLDDGVYDVKALYGAHTVLLHAPSMTAPSSLSLSPPSAADARRGLSGPLTNFTICAVDARGRFFAEPSGTYHVGAVGAVERHAEPEAQAGIGNVQCVPATTSKMAGESKTAAKEMRRAPNKYSMF
ncbi:hypothetical protein, unknown function [Leishmania tarentolae]|uniref:Uncharacterized protein n=1 Tax=Leishmania tarentolae TaxID=5689 RepID=A0A640KEF1_LEITA|nr:hypothetical protein, unknown function [Leishmania tarentolae]